MHKNLGGCSKIDKYEGGGGCLWKMKNGEYKVSRELREVMPLYTAVHFLKKNRKLLFNNSNYFILLWVIFYECALKML